ncbi:MAG: KTSC domain-containing protein [Cytophagales bacterium]|nr:KTSC domain-containing protein [Cytophagales bacterium]
MKRTRVSSSNLASVGYNATSQILEIEFLHGGVYQYFDVPKSEYEALMSAGSHGKYFAAHIKDSYAFEKA